jgi:integrase/recombinase XerD
VLFRTRNNTDRLARQR